MRRKSRPPLTPAQQALVAANKALAHWCVCFFIRKLDRAIVRNLGGIDELDGEALLALCYAAERFDPGRNIKFSTYATTSVLRRLCTHLKVARRKWPFLEPLELDDFDQHPLAPDLPEYFPELRPVLATLPPRLQRIVYFRFWRGMSFEEIGRRLRITKERVRQLLDNALARLREELGAPPLVRAKKFSRRFEIAPPTVA